MVLADGTVGHVPDLVSGPWVRLGPWLPVFRIRSCGSKIRTAKCGGITDEGLAPSEMPLPLAVSRHYGLVGAEPGSYCWPKPGG